MADNIFLGLTTLLAPHWLATTLPADNRALFYIVALVLALPFGYRFERNAPVATAGQVVAALAFGSIGTLSIGMLDAAVGGHAASAATAQDIAASVATIALSHYAGSALAHLRQKRTDRRTAEEAAARLAASSTTDHARSLMHIEPARIKSTAEVVKAVYNAAAPAAAGAAALWAALGDFYSNNLDWTHHVGSKDSSAGGGADNAPVPGSHAGGHHRFSPLRSDDWALDLISQSAGAAGDTGRGAVAHLRHGGAH